STNTNLTEQLALFEKQYIEQNLIKNGNHITNTAKSLGISRQSLQYRMKRLNIRL
ncbi:AAA family ATPase, partial [Butyricicoccus sp. 1XD8-22]